MLLQPNDHILFYGDSITDCGRARPQTGDNNGLGNGYVSLCAALLMARYPTWNLRFTNQGIGGNRVSDLEARLESDVLDFQPTMVSILIGINDTWRRYDSNDPSPIEDFRNAYRPITRAMSERLGARLILCEPFVLPVPDDRRKWREDLDPRIAVTRDVACETGALLLPLDGLFAAASCRTSPAYWAGDGVHPTLAGHALIAENWIRAVTE